MTRAPVRRGAAWVALVLSTVLGHEAVVAQTQGTQGEVRGGLAVGSHSGTAAGLDVAPKLTYELLIVRDVRPRVSLYGGYVRTAFGCEEGFCLDRDLTVSGNHGALGVHLQRGTPWLRLGLLLGTTRVGSASESANVGMGFHLGVGLTIGSGRVRFLPGLFYRRLSASTPSSSDHASALALDFGLGFGLGSS